MMKPLLFALTCAAALCARAENEPVIYFGAAEAPAGQAQRHIEPLTDGILHLKDGRSLCWAAFGLPENLGMREIFHTPAPARFARSNVLLTASHNNTVHEIHTPPRSNGGQYGSCWRFGEDDPEGGYSLTVQIGGTRFPAYSFRLQKP